MSRDSQVKRLFNTNKESEETGFDAVRISIASPEEIRSWSFGEVKRPETINYRTFKPEREGLFCARIFGPIKDYECLCGKYKRMKFRGIVCEKCGVEVTLSRVRRERMGHIDLASPVAHIWFSKSLPSRIGALLDLTTRELDKVLYFESYIVTEPGLTPLKKQQLLSEEEYLNAQEQFGEDSFEALIGARALKTMLKAIDLEKEQRSLSEEIEVTTSEAKRKKLIKRLKLVKAFLHSGARPEWMILDVLPVLPPELRPLVALDGGRFATADLNDLYRRVINRNNRLQRLHELHAPEIIVRNEERMLQESVDALLDNTRRGRPVMGANKRPLKSLSENLKGKQGRFRQNLLGKRVDYSGRSVIVVGPELKLHQCGLPKKMALELFRPFVYSRLEKYGLAPTLKAARRFVEKGRPEIWDILEDVIREHPVLLNRAPTLHRLSIQAFEPTLIEGKAIQLHPLVCKAFNADFDGDTMSVHVPISIEAQLESRILMLSSNNILSPADGSPVIVPSKDIVLGIYYLTLEGKKLDHTPVFESYGEVEHALFEKNITLHTPLQILIEEALEDGITQKKLVTTTPGRLALKQILPHHPGLPFELVNQLLNSTQVATLVNQVSRCCGHERTVDFADALMQLGFRYATQSGISFGKDDLVVPQAKEKLVNETWDLVRQYRQQYLDGLITQGERFNKTTDAWGKCTEKVVTAMMEGMSQQKLPEKINSIYVMAVSGARGSAAQMRQLAAMRGLILKHSGEIIEQPIISNFAEGLKGFEFFNSTHGTRKGLSDTALKTANSGYLTRRLVDVAQDCIVTQEDCGTKEGLIMRSVMEGSEVIAPLRDRIYGRILAEPLAFGRQTLEAGTLITDKLAQYIEDSGIQSVKIRSVLTCATKQGICRKCYGLNLASGKEVSIGEPVGVIAAQSIGEPGTQLTLRTFHLGGAAQQTREDSAVVSPIEGTVHFINEKTVENSARKRIVLSRYMEAIFKDKGGVEQAKFTVPYGAEIFVKTESIVKKGDKVAEWDTYTFPILAEGVGQVKFIDLIEGVSFREVIDEATGAPKRTVIDWRQSSQGTNLKPHIILEDGVPKKGKAKQLEARYFLSPDATLEVETGTKVKPGDKLAQLPRETTKVRDITGGLPRIAELVEARRPKDPAVISEYNGRVEYGKDYKIKRSVVVIPDDESLAPAEYFFPRGKHLLVHEGAHVRKGDILVDGSPVLQDILRVLGVEALASHLINEIQEVYRFQGVKISDKHLEIIVKQMLQKMEVTDPGSTLFMVGDQITRSEFEEVNTTLLKEGKRPIKAQPILQGITKASLQTKSFISAASFQDTTRVLTEAAIWGKVDNLEGFKENVIVGRLIPAGTGWVVNQWKKEGISASPPRSQSIEIGGTENTPSA
jgi:DNA-directed RNA polymerase subunit beta'